VKGTRLTNHGFLPSFSEPDNSLAQSLTSPNVVYMFKLQGFSTITTSSGTIAVSISFDPSSTGYNFSEWTNLAALFDEVKLHSFSVQVCSYFNQTASQLGTPILIGTNLVSSSSPGTEGAVATLTDALYHSPNMTNASGFTHTFMNKGIIGWSTTSSLTVTPYAGCPGSFQLFSSGGTTTFTEFKVLVRGVYAFRARS